MPVAIKLITWNLKDLGDFDRAPSLDFIVETVRHADIILVQEVVCNRASKRLKVDITPARSSGINAVNELVSALATGDAAAGWTSVVSRVNATTTKRDAYAYLWKGTPDKSAYKSGPDAPATIVIDGDTEILKPEDASVRFPDRRPCVVNFKINGEKIPFFNFHASVEKPIDSCRTLSSVDLIASATKGVIAGDFNANFRDQTAFDDVYKFLNTKIGYSPCLGDLSSKETGVRTSIAPKQPENGYYSSAYDNVLIKGVTKRSSRAIDIIDRLRAGKYSSVSRERGLRFAMTVIYPRTGRKRRFTKRTTKVPCVSDHRPVETDIEIS
jgi:endonuclease/exonuclease/phosphatase family metal-dependent hydrolase